MRGKCSLRSFPLDREGYSSNDRRRKIVMSVVIIWGNNSEVSEMAGEILCVPAVSRLHDLGFTSVTRHAGNRVY